MSLMKGQHQQQEEEEEIGVVVKSSSSSSSSKCQDCGNQAKKDCGYSRCRTCCKNKGFQCQTHIRSTWIPTVDRRRHRSLITMDPSPTISHLQRDYNDTDIPKRHKNNNPLFSEDMEFPAAMSSMAIFSCVRVRSMDDTVNEIAYQTSVNIGGHIFSGLLYDQGPHEQQQQQSFNNSTTIRHKGEASTTHNNTHLVHHHHQQQQQQQQHNLNLMMMSGDAIHARHGVTLPSLPPATTSAAAHEQFFPLPNSFRPAMSYFSQKT